MEKKKLLLLGGSNSIEDFVTYSKTHNIELIATGKYKDTPLKRIADKEFDVDAIDDNGLIELIKNEKIDGVFVGCNETVVPHAINATQASNLPCYCNNEQWEVCANKLKFKDMCKKNGVPVAGLYTIEDVKTDRVNYPVAVKPADSCGSQGFSRCDNKDEVFDAYDKAISFSPTDTVIIEEFMPYDAVIIHYTLANNEIYFSGMSDKISAKIKDTNSSVMAFQSFPSAFTEHYLKDLDEKVKAMFITEGFHDGPIWIEAFNNNGKFVFNEMGYRFGGSMTYHPIRYFYGFDQLQLLLDYDLGKTPDINNAKEMIDINKPDGKKYAIMPLHLTSGVIDKIAGVDEIMKNESVYTFVPTHDVGDEIKATGTVSQVFCYMHILYDTQEDLRKTINTVLDTLKVYSKNGDNMLFSIIDFNEELI